MQLKVPQLSVRQAGLQTISIGQLGIGPISVGSLALNNIGFTFSAAHAVLQNVEVTLTLRITLEWHIYVGLPDDIPDINVGNSWGFSMSFSLPVGTITIPGLSSLKFDIPSLTAQNLLVSASPLAVQLNDVAAEAVHATEIAAPKDGFAISGLSFGSLAGGGIGAPAATVGDHPACPWRSGQNSGHFPQRLATARGADPLGRQHDPAHHPVRSGGSRGEPRRRHPSRHSSHQPVSDDAGPKPADNGRERLGVDRPDRAARRHPAV